ncbi:conserved hypothetical protein, HNE_0200 family [Alteromonadaceae bacterium Bs31]|nr:conserved hypothetical protein, HNE_0200 family [Alteromonadaceae bacterium Bs31]
MSNYPTCLKILLALPFAIIAACGGGDGSTPGPTIEAPTSTPSQEPTLQPTSLQPTQQPSQEPGAALTRHSNTSCLAPAQISSGDGDFQLIPAFPDLPALNGLLGLYQAPGRDSHWYALLREGQIIRFQNSPDTSSYETLVDISASVRTGFERGALGFAFHPDFARKGYFYISYINSEDYSIISRFTFSGSLPVAGSTEKEILRLLQPAGNHNGGNIAFGPDNYLYIGFGDGGGSNDQYGHGQRTSSLHSTLLRIDVDNGEPYAIPSDNPFVGNDAFLPEIYAYGLRNPWRWSFDTQSGELWLADVGQGSYEELDIVKAGDNLGWPLMEGNHCFAGQSCSTSGLTLPVHEYSQSGCASVTGGFVYRGTQSPEINGHYFYADYCTGEISRIWRNGENYENETVANAPTNVASFAQANDGEVYVLAINGSAGNGIYQIVYSENSSISIAQQLSQTGCFSSTPDLQAAEGVVPYSIKSKLWSDGADKTRYFAIPDGTKISIDTSGDFLFPTGSVLIKNFFDGESIIETRLLMNHNTGWAGYSYQWLEAKNDAILLDKETQLNTGNFIHTFPSQAQCNVCHTGAAQVSLGIEASQLDTEHSYAQSGITSNQNDALYQAGYLYSLPTATQVSELADINDNSASTALRARSYLHSNCSGCHRPNSTAAQIDLRIQTSLADTGICDVAPIDGNWGLTNARVVAPGSAASSVLYERMATADDHRMPPLGTNLIDQAALSVIESWIDNMADCTGRY